MDVAAKLAKYAHLMNEHGVDSVEARKFLDDNGEDDEFTDLALLSQRLKREFSSQTAQPARAANRTAARRAKL